MSSKSSKPSLTVKTYPLLTHAVQVRPTSSGSGGLHATFQFVSEQSAQHWIETELPAISTKYGPSAGSITPLDGLRVGDSCYVVGEGTDLFVIKDVVCYSPHSYGFVLDTGCSEGVSKCGRQHPSLYGAPASVVQMDAELSNAIQQVEAITPGAATKVRKPKSYQYSYTETVPNAPGESYQVVQYQGTSKNNPGTRLATKQNLEITPIFDQPADSSEVPPSYVVAILSDVQSTLRTTHFDPSESKILSHLSGEHPHQETLCTPQAFALFESMRFQQMFNESVSFESNAVLRATLEPLKASTAWEPLYTLSQTGFDFEVFLEDMGQALVKLYEQETRESLGDLGR